MNFLILGGEKDRAAWAAVFRELPDAEISELDPAEGLDGYKETETAARFDAAARELKPDAVCIAAERKYHACLAVKAAELGIHALAVPPLGDTAEEMNRAAEAAAGNGVVLMAAYSLVHRPGILRLLSLLYSGKMGGIKSAVFETSDYFEFKSDLARINLDTETYHRYARAWSERVCLANKIMRSDSFSMPESFELSRDSNIETVLDYGGAEVKFISRNPMRLDDAAAARFEEAGVSEAPGIKITDKLKVICDAGTLTCFKTLDSEILDFQIGGKRKAAALPSGNEHSAAAGYFTDFISKGVAPFVDGPAAFAAELGARKIMALFQRRGSRALIEKSGTADVPAFLAGLEKAGESATGDIMFFSYENYIERFPWKASRPFRLLLLAAPGDEPYGEFRVEALFTPLSISVLGAVAARHGCGVELDDLARFMLKPGVLSADEIAKIWPARPNPRDPLYQDAIGSAAAKIADSLATSSFDLIGISLIQNTQFDLIVALCGELKKRTAAPIVTGGSINYDLSRLEPHADFMASGEGEIPLLALIRHIADGWPIENVPGLIKPAPERVAPYIIADIRIRGVPMYKPELMALYARDGVPFFPFIFINGCPHKCAFCINYAPCSQRILEPHDAISQLAEITRRYGARRFYFLNNLINHSNEYMNSFLEGLITAGLNIVWSDCACLHGLDKPALEKMRKAGCRKITWGLDTGSARLSRLNHKPINIADAGHILRISREAGIYNVVNLITGLPHETPEDTEETVAFIERNKQNISKVFHMKFIYGSSSPVFLEPEKYGLIKKGATFDETGGLKWESKLEQTAKHYEIVEKYLAANEKYFHFFEWEMMAD